LLKTVEPSSNLEEPGFVRTMTGQVNKSSGLASINRTETENFISEKISKLIEAVSEQFKETGKLSKDNRNEITSMLRIMSSVLPCETAEQYDLLFPIIIKNLKDENDDLYLKLESLAICRTVLKTESEPDKFKDHAEELLD